MGSDKPKIISKKIYFKSTIPWIAIFVLSILVKIAELCPKGVDQKTPRPWYDYEANTDMENQALPLGIAAIFALFTQTLVYLFARKKKWDKEIFLKRSRLLSAGVFVSVATLFWYIYIYG